jgi:cullin-associated NEDD8-dissociated protein 1
MINIASTLLSYDPHYNEFAEDDMNLDYDEDSDPEEFSDDDDTSWKVRRASVRLFAAIILKFKPMSKELYQNIGRLLIKRLDERIEIVRIQIIQTLETLVSQLAQDDASSDLDLSNFRVRKKRKGLNPGQEFLSETYP